MKLPEVARRIARRILRNECAQDIEDALALATKGSRAIRSDLTRFDSAQGVGQDWRPVSFGEYAAKSVPVYTAIKARAEALATLKWEAFETHNDGSVVPLGKNTTLARILEAPNPWFTGEDLRRATEWFLSLYGACFWTLEPNELNITGRTTELWPIRPDRMTVVPGTGGRRAPHIRGFVYHGQNGDIPFTPDEVVFFRYFNPLASHTGLSPIAPLRLTIDMAQDALRFNRNTFQNSAIPDYLLIAKETMNQEQVNEFYARWEERYKGPANARRPAIASNLEDVHKMAFSNRDLEYAANMRLSVKDASRVYGVPEVFMGELQFATLSNIDRYEQIFWRNAILPEANAILAAINRQMLPRLEIPQRIQVRWDTSEIPALQEGEKDRIARETAYLKAGVMTINEVRRARGWEDVPWGDQPQNQTPQRRPAPPDE